MTELQPTRVCVKCGKPATVKFGNDPDLTGVPACDNCKEDVRLALIISLTENKDFTAVLKSMKRKKPCRNRAS
jgi:hypothetical protein